MLIACLVNFVFRIRDVGRERRVSRVLYPVSGTVTICLGRDLRRVSSDRYPRTGRAAVKTSSYLVLLRAGFTWPAGRPAAGGLLPHLFTLTRRRFSGDQPRPAVVFCGTFLRVAPTGCCPAPCSLEPGLSSNTLFTCRRSPIRLGPDPVYPPATGFLTWASIAMFTSLSARLFSSRPTWRTVTLSPNSLRSSVA